MNENEQDKYAMEKALVQAVTTFCGGFLERCGDALKDALTEQMKNSIRRAVGAEIYRALHALGGADASDQYFKGWDEAISAAIGEVTRLTGVDDDCLEVDDSE